MNRVLVTGAAGFIGMHTARALLDAGAEVVGVDNLDPYYDVRLKEARLATLATHPSFRFERLDLAQPESVQGLFDGFDAVDRLKGRYPVPGHGAGERAEHRLLTRDRQACAPQGIHQ